jgi:hypothetical protein
MGTEEMIKAQPMNAVVLVCEISLLANKSSKALI